MVTESAQNFLMWTLNMRKDIKHYLFKTATQKISYYKN